jgi:HPt (histidine-containing phosphotransfer) domain-containing protein
MTGPIPPHDLVPSLDEAALERLRELDPDGSLGVVVRVLNTFLQALARDMDRLVQARDGGDLKTVGEIAHKVKSSSASVGALALSAQCADVERRVRAGELADIAPRIESLLAEGRLATLAAAAAVGT